MIKRIICKPRLITSKTPHTLIAGLSGFGKGNFGEWYSMLYMLSGWKVIDINSEARGEGMYYGLPNNDTKLLGMLKYQSNGILKPRKFNNKTIMFLGKNLRKIKKIPKNITISVFDDKSLENEDLINFLAFNEVQRHVLYTIIEIHKNKRLTLTYLHDFMMKVSDMNSLQYYIIQKFKLHYAAVSSIRRRVNALYRSGLFYKPNEKEKKLFNELNLEKEVNKLEEVTTFSTYLMDDPFIRYICIYILLKKFIELLEYRKLKHPVLIYIREGKDFFHDIKDYPYLKFIQHEIDKILRRGRTLGKSKIALIMDTQYISDIPPSLYDGFNKVMCVRLPKSQSKYLCLKANIPEKYLTKLSNLQPGVGMFVCGGEFEYPIQIPPTLHKKAEPDFDVFSHLMNKYGYINYKGCEYLELEPRNTGFANVNDLKSDRIASEGFAHTENNEWSPVGFVR